MFLRGLSSSCSKWELLSGCHARLSRCGGFSYVKHRLQSTWPSSCGSWALERRLSSWGTCAWLLRAMWDPPQPRSRTPMSPALTGGLFTTEPPGKPLYLCFYTCSTYCQESIQNIHCFGLFKFYVNCIISYIAYTTS